jgi:hypothetical protein
MTKELVEPCALPRALFLHYLHHFAQNGRHGIFLCMSDQGSDDGQVKQRMDAMLLRLLKTPPQSREELAEAVRRAKLEKKATRIKRESQTKKSA